MKNETQCKPVIEVKEERLFSLSGTEGGGVTLVCGNEGKVVWGKGADGGRSDILTAEGGVITQKLRADPGNRYRVMSDLSLVIVNLSLSDSGTYYCNSVPVVNLTVYPAPPAGHIKIALAVLAAVLLIVTPLLLLRCYSRRKAAEARTPDHVYETVNGTAPTTQPGGNPSGAVYHCVPSIPRRSINHLPLRSINLLPLRSINRLPLPSINRLPLRSINRLPLLSINRLPLRSINRLPLRSINRLPLRSINRLPLRSINRLPLRSIDRLPLRPINRLPLRSIERLPLRSINRLPLRSINRLPLRSIDRLPLRPINRLPLRSIDRLPLRSIDLLPLRSIDRLPLRSIDCLPLPSAAPKEYEAVYLLAGDPDIIKLGLFSLNGTEGGGVTLVCGNEGKVVWGKGAGGGRSVILTAEGGVITKHRADPGNRYRVLPDLSLWIVNLSLSDSGIYYCNSVPVVDLTVYPAPSADSDESSEDFAKETPPTPTPPAPTDSSEASTKEPSPTPTPPTPTDLEDFLKDSAKETPPTQRPPTPTKYWIALVVMGGVVLLLALGSLSIKKFYPMEKEGCEMLYDDVYTSIEYVSFSKEQA
ncbi:hypothetical protein NFI96_024305, partial [Prochilodus magdalenae]